jgi:hypothetical protein
MADCHTNYLKTYEYLFLESIMNPESYTPTCKSQRDKRYLSSEQYCRTHADDLSQPIWFEKIQKKLEEQDGMRQ